MAVIFRICARFNHRYWITLASNRINKGGVKQTLSGKDTQLVGERGYVIK